MPQDRHHDSCRMYIMRITSRESFKRRHGRNHNTSARLDSFHLQKSCEHTPLKISQHSHYTDQQTKTF
ncbi:hypothetical protein HanXRQr2_Chr17g0829151 [Helianthus annuus]|uniref:Uncharacterized protein n=1 Tax=Helianthus annuus TaxID=4232 RepID=A0A9K3GXD6_HELAN|nr:hypothetical protein HanXRQr2_Chr17g0829151 [Helianthus annuus]